MLSAPVATPGEKKLLVLLCASVERFGVSRMRDFCVCLFVLATMFVSCPVPLCEILSSNLGSQSLFVGQLGKYINLVKKISSSVCNALFFTRCAVLSDWSSSRAVSCNIFVCLFICFWSGYDAFFPALVPKCCVNDQTGSICVFSFLATMLLSCPGVPSSAAGWVVSSSRTSLLGGTLWHKGMAWLMDNGMANVEIVY